MSLQQMFDTGNPVQDFYNSSMQNRALQGQQDQQMADAQQAHSFNDQMNPLKLAYQQAMNDQHAATLPGMQAESRMAQRKDANAALLNDDEIAHLHDKYGAEHTAAKAQKMDEFGDELNRQAQQVWSNPVGGVPRVKQAFQEAGMEKMWNPKWDSMQPDQLALELSDLGKGLQTTSGKFQQQLMLQKTKNDSAEARAAMAADNRIQLQGMKPTPGAGGTKPLSMSQYEAQLREAAQLGDEDAKQSLNLLQQQRVQQRTAGVEAGQTTKPDLNLLGVTTVGKNRENKDKYPKAPDIGTIVVGKSGKFKYMGGDPGDSNTWKKQ